MGGRFLAALIRLLWPGEGLCFLFLWEEDSENSPGGLRLQQSRERSFIPQKEVCTWLRERDLGCIRSPAWPWGSSHQNTPLQYTCLCHMLCTHEKLSNSGFKIIGDREIIQGLRDNTGMQSTHVSSPASTMCSEHCQESLLNTKSLTTTGYMTQNKQGHRD